MKRIVGLIVAGGLWLGMASAADAQFSMAVGNPYYGGFSLSVPYAGGYGVPYGGYGVVPGETFYSSGYAGVYPGVTTYSSGYYGVAPVVPPVTYAGYGYRPFYGVAAYPQFGYYGVYRPFGFGFGRRMWGFY